MISPKPLVVLLCAGALSAAALPAWAQDALDVERDVIAHPIWEMLPADHEFSDMVQEAAAPLTSDVLVQLDCKVLHTRYLRCDVRPTDAPDFGLGQAAVRLSGSFRASARQEEGKSPIGRYVVLPFQFQAATGAAP